MGVSTQSTWGFFQDHPPDNMIRIALLACTAALAAADADALYGIAGHHLGYDVGHVGYAAHHAAPVHHGYGISNVATTVGIHGVAPAAIPAVHGAYAGAGRYVANSAGTVHVAKREADAEPEADAAALYGLMDIVDCMDMDTVLDTVLTLLDMALDTLASIM